MVKFVTKKVRIGKSDKVFCKDMDILYYFYDPSSKPHVFSHLNVYVHVSTATYINICTYICKIGMFKLRGLQICISSVSSQGVLKLWVVELNKTNRDC